MFYRINPLSIYNIRNINRTHFLIHLRTNVHHLTFHLIQHHVHPHFLLWVVEISPLSGVLSKGGSKTLSVAGKLVQLQLTSFMSSKGVTGTSSVSGIAAATPLVFADKI